MKVCQVTGCGAQVGRNAAGQSACESGHVQVDMRICPVCHTGHARPHCDEITPGIAPFGSADAEAKAIIESGIPPLPQAIIMYCNLATELGRAQSAGLRHLRPLEVHTGKVIQLLSKALELQVAARECRLGGFGDRRARQVLAQQA